MATPSAPAPPLSEPPPTASAALRMFDVIVAVLPASTATAPCASIVAFVAEAVVVLSIWFTAATPAPVTPRPFPPPTPMAMLAAAAPVLIVPVRVAAIVTPPASVLTVASVMPALTPPEILLRARLAARATVNESFEPNAAAIEAAPTAAEMVELLSARTVTAPASIATAPRICAVVAMSMTLWAAEPARFTDAELSLPLALTPTETATVVASIVWLDVAATRTAPTARTGVPEIVARTAAPAAITLLETEAPTPIPVAAPCAEPLAAIDRAPVSAAILAVSLARTSRLPALKTASAPSPTFEPASSATVEPPTVLRATAPPPETPKPLP
ncbi:hypothetical protein GCM10008965_16690 [Methylorubrum aminovorans]